MREKGGSTLLDWEFFFFFVVVVVTYSWRGATKRMAAKQKVTLNLDLYFDARVNTDDEYTVYIEARSCYFMAVLAFILFSSHSMLYVNLK